MNTEMTLSQASKMLRIRPADAHKGTMGHALLMAGSHGIAGCAVLAAESCLRSGVGKLTVLSAESNRIILQTAVPEAIVSMDSTLPLEGFQALGIGPGIGTDAEPELERLIKGTNVPLVLDADALHIIAEHPSFATNLKTRTILTPHVGEMMHLTNGLKLKGSSPVECAAAMAKQYNCIVVMKGHPTYICLPNGNTVSCPRGNAGMATAGSGDVLTGIITGLLAQGYPLTDAAELGVWLHASAGDDAAQQLGQECMLTRDIIHHLPQAFAELYENRNNIL